MRKFTVKSKLKYGKFYLAEKGRRVKIRKFTRLWGRKNVVATQNRAMRAFTDIRKIAKKSQKRRSKKSNLRQGATKRR